jgi:predicted GNAT family acetyltransferase
VEPSRLNVFQEAAPYYEHHWSGSRETVWDLLFLATDQKHRGQGCGRRLVAYGLERADEDDLAASVVSAESKDRFYLRCGFRVIVGNVCDGDGNPMAEVRGGTILFRDQGSILEQSQANVSAQ